MSVFPFLYRRSKTPWVQPALSHPHLPSYHTTPYAEPFPIFCKHVPFLYSRSKTMIVHATTLKRNHLP